jgi:peroxidase
MANKLWFIGFLVVCAALIASASNPFINSEEHPESWEEWLHYYKDLALDTIGVEYDDYPFMKFASELPFDKEDFDRLLRHSVHKAGGEWDNAAALGLPKDWKVDPECQSKDKFFYRTMDGSCNWPKDGEAEYGRAGNAFSRDVPYTYYDDSVSTPRKGPSPRELSNEFFAKTTNETGYEHTPILVGLIEFVIHDIAWSVPSQKEIDYIPVPKCDPFFDPKCEGDKKMPVWRNQPIKGTGTNSTNPRQSTNGATSWLDLSAMYGTDEKMGRKLRVGKQGKMLTQIGPDGGEYPPFNTLGLHMIGNANQSKLFATGDPRGNQDWLLMAIETLLLREHNRVCDLLVAQHPDWDDDKLYGFARIVMSTKYQMIANLYQQAYFTKEMPKPRWDGLPLFRQWHGKNVLQLNPYHPYPFQPALVNGKPVTTSQEMAIGYRFHEILPTDVPLIDEAGKVTTTYNIVNTSFDAEGFLKVGLDAVLRGMASIKIPRFHTGTSDIYRNMRFNFGDPQEHTGFDLVAWTIYHERERGLPTFNQYFTYYTGVPEVPIRKKFEDFTTNPKYLAALKRLYANPDEVDLTVGQYLDESYYPGTTVPRSQLITSLFSLFALGIADRFSPGKRTTTA